ncbi:MAG: AMP-binding protein [Eubacteriales bacterium]|nr:AMP-binding protein [Eubacteriales bacterium]
MLDRFLKKTEFSSYEDFIENYAVNVPENFNFSYDVVDVWAETEPDKTALIYCNDEGYEHVFSFREISRRSMQIANMLKRLGVVKGCRVLLMLRRRYEYWLTACALHRIGAVLIPASIQMASKDIAYRCDAAGVMTVIAVNDEYTVTQIEHAALPTVRNRILVDGERDGWISFDEYEKEADVFLRPEGKEQTHNDDTMLMYFTSGTTGMPKMVMHTFTYPLGHITTAKYWQCVENNGLHMTVSDSGWAKFGWGNIYGQWICGSAILGYDYHRFDAHRLLEIMQKYPLTTFCVPPTIYRFLIKEDLSAADLSGIKRCTTAGEPLNPEVYDRFLEQTGQRIVEGFGQSESSVLMANFPWVEYHGGSMGKPSPLYRFDVIDAEGRSCGIGEEGELVVRFGDGPLPLGLACGYYRNPEKTEEVWDHGVYHTGDKVWYDESGYYWYLGRNDDMIKCSGYRIGPFEVESVLMEHPSVLECCITAVPDALRGQIVKATIVLAKGYEPSDALIKELQTYVKKNTAPYKYPRLVEFVDELPKTVSGKIQRNVIRARDEAKRRGY